MAEAVRIMGELLDALHFAHEAGVIHRDVKPANVMLDAQRRVKLADFGVARIQDSERSAAGTMVGTPAYMSPEQVQGQKIDRRTDLFSAGVVLYQLLTGERPFAGQGAWTVAKKIIEHHPPSPSSLVSTVSPAFDGVVSKALAKSAAERFANARVFADALRGALVAGPTATPVAPPAPKARLKALASESELEFWRAIQNSTEAAEFEFYLEQFPEGMYASLARHKIARLREARNPAAPAPTKVKSITVPATIAAVVLAGAIGAYFAIGRKPAPAPLEETPPAKSAAAPGPAVDAEKIRRETEERLRKEFEAKAAAERAALEKTVLDKIAAERAAAEKVVQAKTAAEKAAAEKVVAAAAADRQAAQKAAAEKAAANKAEIEKAEAQRAAVERAAIEKAAAEKAAAEKVIAEKAAAEKALAEKAAVEKLAAASDEAKLERFAQRVGRDKVMKQEPINLPQGRVVYITDGSCGSGRIKEIVGGVFASTSGAQPNSRGDGPRTRCIPLE
jgi:serine/threonine-protein kinase